MAQKKPDNNARVEIYSDLSKLNSIPVQLPPPPPTESAHGRTRERNLTECKAVRKITFGSLYSRYGGGCGTGLDGVERRQVRAVHLGAILGWTIANNTGQRLLADPKLAAGLVGGGTALTKAVSGIPPGKLAASGFGSTIEERVFPCDQIGIKKTGGPTFRLLLNATCHRSNSARSKSMPTAHSFGLLHNVYKVDYKN